MSTDRDLNYRLFVQREMGFKRTAFQSEFEKYAAICSGDVELVKANFQEIRKNYFAGKGSLSNDPVRNVRYHVVISAAIIARACVSEGLEHDTAYTLSDIYIQKADLCTSIENLIELLGEMQVDFAVHMRELSKENANSFHIRRCIDYIYEHLNEKLTLEELSDYIHLNKSYLSKLFLKEMGISIKKYIISVKVRTAENMLKYSEKSSLDISLALGFSSQSAFVNTFKKYNGQTPLKYRNMYLK